ncbi:hypothetical protein [Mucilaginibacter terrae]|uniref:Uncharacterized protein n=1 Tax=Mucilaginibacter terrae TaxID=1955052 RepID=A0ABU3GWW2_9SPHI|nr:hypothetical protein [Mucilaginibacter terrae]MDT3403160.1 hypothetical protein [Mucilaginibacter terrae]
MKKAALTPIVFLGVVAFNWPQQKLLKSFTLGKFSYNLYEENYYVHDNNVDGAFFVVYRTGQKGSLCSAWMKATRNDSVLTRGTYIIGSNRVEFKEVYFHKHEAIDSLVKTFSPDAEGDLQLRELKEYRKGVVSKKMY